MNIVNITSPTYTAELGDAVLKCNAAAIAIAVTLYKSVAGYSLTIRKADIGEKYVTIYPASGDTIDGMASIQLCAPNAFVTLAAVVGGWSVIDRPSTVHFRVSAVDATVATTTGIHAAVTDTGEAQVITTGITQPSVPRNITATAGGTSGDIKAIQVTITGTNFLDEVIAEDLPAFTVNTTGTVAGTKAFKTITQIDLPAHDGTGATTAIGFGEILGLWDKLTHNTVIFSYLDNTVEATAATVTVSATAIESNTIDLNSALDSKVIDAYYLP
jgi:hypothetical protein